MKTTTTAFVALALITAVVLSLLDNLEPQMAATAIPIVLEYVKYALIARAAEKEKKITTTRKLLILEAAKFALVCAGLFIFASPTDPANAASAIAYCSAFFAAQITGSAVHSITNGKLKE